MVESSIQLQKDHWAKKAEELRFTLLNMQAKNISEFQDNNAVLK
jgi:hypothetical protein